MKLDYEHVIIDPASHFSDPNDILDSQSYSETQKRKLLKAWQLDITLLHVCEEENMSNSDDVKMLSRINRALNTLPPKN